MRACRTTRIHGSAADHNSGGRTYLLDLLVVFASLGNRGSRLPGDKLLLHQTYLSQILDTNQNHEQIATFIKGRGRGNQQIASIWLHHMGNPANLLMKHFVYQRNDSCGIPAYLIDVSPDDGLSSQNGQPFVGGVHAQDDSLTVHDDKGVAILLQDAFKFVVQKPVTGELLHDAPRTC